jgi:hypothetical protein
MNTRGFARLGVLALGLGIAAAMAHSPVAAADTYDFQISFDGMDLFPTTDNAATATTVAGEFGLAIAYGNGATAVAEGGTGDYALASGTNALAEAGSLTASSGNNFDAAYDIGNNTGGPYNGAFAGGNSLTGDPDLGTSSHDTAIDIGDNGGSNSGAYAGNGVATSNGDTAYTFGNTDGRGDGSYATSGDNNYASFSGNATGDDDYAYAGQGNGNSAIDNTSANIDDTTVIAYGVNNNDAYLYGPDNSTAYAFDGNGNIAFVNDPFGSAGAPDNATAGEGFNNDLAGVLFTHGNAVATGADYVYDIISPLGPETGTAAATGSTSLLSELLALF